MGYHGDFDADVGQTVLTRDQLEQKGPMACRLLTTVIGRGTTRFGQEL